MDLITLGVILITIAAAFMLMDTIHAFSKDIVLDHTDWYIKNQKDRA